MQTNPSTQRILVYGDSLVHGRKPWWPRYDAKTRFTGVAQDILGSDYDIIEEGLRGRMLVGENAFFPYRNGYEQFGPIFASHLPLDAVMIYLGTNDCNVWSNLSYETFSQALDSYRERMQRWSVFFKLDVPRLLLVCPHRVEEEYSYPVFNDIFRWATEKSINLTEYYRQYASSHNLPLLNTSVIVTASQVDGVHLDVEMNEILGQAMSLFVKENT